MTTLNHLKVELQSLSGFLTVLGEPKRQIILVELLKEGACHGVQVGELQESTGLSRPAVSHHLKILKDADIVTCREVGTRNFYSISHENQKLYQLRDFLSEVINELEELKGND